MKHNCSVGRRYKKGKEIFSWKKFRKIFYLGSLVEWIKSIKEICDLRKLIIYGIAIALFFAYGYGKGQKGKPIKVDIGYGKEAIIEINKEGDNLYIDKKGFVYIRDKKGNILKQVSAGDIPTLRAKLKHYGFQFKPIFVMGAGFGEDGIEPEGGVGISYFRYFKFRLEAFLTNKGVYPLAIAYKITDNSGAGLGAGKGWSGDNRVIFYYRFEF